jgi:DNA-binding GntR family transcriptional regulator
MEKKSIILGENEIYYPGGDGSSLTKTVYERMLSKFMNNEFLPGQMLNRRKLAGEMGVSVAPVLEALVQLERDGFIKSVPRKGTFVQLLRERDIYEQYILREALECTAVRFYAGRLVREHKDELLKYAVLVDRDELSSIPHIKREIIFHASLVNLAGFPLLTREYLRITRIRMFSLVNLQPPLRDNSHYQMHDELVEELTTDDIDKAEKIIRAHIWLGKIF